MTLNKQKQLSYKWFGSFVERNKAYPLKTTINSIQNKHHEGNLIDKIVEKLYFWNKKTYLDRFSKDVSILWQTLKKAQLENQNIKN